MTVRPLPHLSELVNRHKHVALLWDERLEGRALLGVGSAKSICVEQPKPGDWRLWEGLTKDATQRGRWSMGWIGYDMHRHAGGPSHNERRQELVPPHPGGWPVLHWWEPEVVLEWAAGEREPQVVVGEDADMVADVLDALNGPIVEPEGVMSQEGWIPLAPSWDKATYLKKFDAVQKALQRGDIYEMNLCMPWVGQAPGSASWTLFERLAKETKAPHSAYVQAGDHRVLCASPERFLERRGSKLTSQPIKGTAKRDKDPVRDKALRERLGASEKERAENVMIVDLVRNDLSRVAAPNSVEVEELFGLHTFSTVHQMISTVSCTLRKDVTPLEVMHATFPMGSMTGAPKRSAMDHISRIEGVQRGVYSGTIGYIDGQGDFDMNVVIRSLLHRADTGRVDATVGGALTLLAQGEEEHEECLLKIHALRISMGHE